MVGQVVGAAKLLQLLYYWLPKGILVALGKRGRGRGVGCGKRVGIDGIGTLGANGCSIVAHRHVGGIGHGVLGILLGGIGHGRALATLLYVNARGRHAVLVVASAILKVSVDVIVGLGELHLLHELHAALEIAKVHLEERVKLLYLVATRLQLAHKLHAIELVDIERGRGWAVTAQARAIYMPAATDFSRENDFALSAVVSLQRSGKLHGIQHLGIGHDAYKHQQGQCQ